MGRHCCCPEKGTSSSSSSSVLHCTACTDDPPAQFMVLLGLFSEELTPSCGHCAEINGSYYLDYVGPNEEFPVGARGYAGPGCLWRYEFPSPICGYTDLYLMLAHDSQAGDDVVAVLLWRDGGCQIIWIEVIGPFPLVCAAIDTDVTLFAYTDLTCYQECYSLGQQTCHAEAV